MITYTKRTFTLVIVANDWKQFKCPSTEDWINKSRYAHPMILIIILKLLSRWKMKTTQNSAQCVRSLVLRKSKIISAYACIYTGDSGNMHRKMVTAAAPTRGNGCLVGGGGGVNQWWVKNILFITQIPLYL